LKRRSKEGGEKRARHIPGREKSQDLTFYKGGGDKGKRIKSERKKTEGVFLKLEVPKRKKKVKNCALEVPSKRAKTVLLEGLLRGGRKRKKQKKKKKKKKTIGPN